MLLGTRRAYLIRRRQIATRRLRAMVSIDLISITVKAQKKAAWLLNHPHQAFENLNSKPRRRLEESPRGSPILVRSSRHQRLHNRLMQVLKRKRRNPFRALRESSQTLLALRRPLQKMSRKQIQQCNSHNHHQSLEEHRSSRARFAVCQRQAEVLG